ncbi:helix-turn-helix domain-containing protein [Bacillus sp. FJAT-49711]|uniref:helix-turn-helix domain-containing protein n=1 Tax=Bacillus sp. FJAT-49711 TaxID=2833585 RepID=UPI001BC98D27|nr:Rgg/GadR/MutR family transcriptional regulator [Bacillus sp. FJAT-49711]MBS4220987.1 helix-turn-helix domain-containing protein [Bacillus sp. FJAT-49711]
MNDYGKTIRKIREEKGYTLQQLSDGILSTSFLSKFERGNSDISVSYFLKILEKLSLSYDEFLFVHNDFNLDNFETFFDKAEQAYVKRNLSKLQTLKEVHMDKWRTTKVAAYRCNTLVLDVLINIVRDEFVEAEKEAIEFLFDYLFQVEVWGYYELRLYNATMFLMPPKMVLTLSETAYKKSVYLRKLAKVNQIIIYILSNTITYLLRHNIYLRECKVFLGYLDNISIPEKDLLSRNHLLYLQGLYEIKIGNKEKGIEVANKAISMFRELGSTSLVTERENFLHILLNDTPLFFTLNDKE